MKTKQESKLERHLRRGLGEGRRLFVPYLTAGLPSPQRFVELVSDLAASADAVEVGIPFSDPIMDGPVIQEASTRALESGVTVEGCFALIREAQRHASVPVVVMTYFNPIHRMGIDRFARTVGELGVRGAVVPDLPFEESGELAAALAGRDVALVQMVAPATSPERARMVARGSSGFVYGVSRLGVTGERESLAESAKGVVERIRPHTHLPVLLGIGISNARQAREAAEAADGVIVGSALMKRVIAGDVASAVALAKEIREALSSFRK